MFGFFKRKKKHESDRESQENQVQEPLVDQTVEATDAPAPTHDAAEVVVEHDPADSPIVEIEPDAPQRDGAREALRDEVVPGDATSGLDETPVETPRDQLAEEVTRPEAEAAKEAMAYDAAAEPEKAPVIESEPMPEPELLAAQASVEVDAPDAAAEKRGWFARIKAGLGKTRANLSDGIADLFLGKKQIDDELMEDLETQLLMADVGIEATSEIIDSLAGRVSRKELRDPQALYRALQDELAAMLEPVAKPLQLPPKGEGPFVILMVGVNGVGKTTTIGKLTKHFQAEGRSVMLAAGDTFRAAAVEQLKVWGERNTVPVIAQHTGADSASVIYDALSAARARKVDVLIADTAGRLHNKSHLMEELKKVRRVMAKLDEAAPHEVMLVLDAGTGQNALAQASTFHEAVPITGITLTKLDGTAKGGIIFALAKQLATPIRYIGVGETADDLRAFEARDFVKALFERDDSSGDETP
ncbi:MULTISPECIES: signal recognition particle-docking protein FtsY [Halomonadaceae]|uniref:signal recognition particle-docking protein FtsY n=1 Tax=Halomonadaceae TaxID=28256 RepID=UPI001599D296|nr:MULTISPECIES: signal recognition particle-docking protein FtsY [Halomonas]QJQ94591.1 signal recognition particle-docking protein FtsY [Halomonas sp. PA5]